MTRAATSAPLHHRGVTAAVMVLAIAGSLGIARGEAAPFQAATASEPGLLCRSAIQQAEIGTQLPPHLMGAIARVESGRPDPSTGRIHPWPWTINAEGQGNFFETKAQAIAFTRQLQARGVQSIDVGCMQINLMFHPDAFQSLDEAFNPFSNARYAARFLVQLRDKTGNWETASAWYHSANPEEGAPYRDKVVTVMASETKGSPSYGVLPVPALVTSPVGVSPISGMFAARGNIIMLPRAPTGAIVARLNAGVAGVNGSSTGPMLLIGGTFPPGRGLDAYRLQPVRMLSLVAPN
jgi:hypothetical protein